MPETRKISEIAKEIVSDWKNPYFGAKPYINAMMKLENMKSSYAADSARSIVAYFLGNAQGWRGEVAKRVKKELNDMLKKR